MNVVGWILPFTATQTSKATRIIRCPLRCIPSDLKLKAYSKQYLNDSPGHKDILNGQTDKQAVDCGFKHVKQCRV